LKSILKLGIREKFMFYVVITLMLLGAILTRASILQQQKILFKLETEIKKRGASLSQGLASRSVLNLLLDDSQNLQKLVDDLEQEEDVKYVIITDSHGNAKAEHIVNIDIPKEIAAKAAAKMSADVECYVVSGERFCEFITPIYSKQKAKSEYIEMFVELEESSSQEQDNTKIGVARIGISFQSIDLQSKILVKRNYLLMLVMVFVCAVLSLYFFSRLITIHINNLIKVATLAAEKGDLTRTVTDMKSTDEMGMLVASFNKMIEGLHRIVFEVKITSERVNNLAQSLSTSSQEMNASTQEVSSTIQNISQGIGVQERRIEDTSRVIERMTASVKQVAVNANEGAKASGETAQLAQEGMRASQEAVDKTRRTTEVADEIASVVKKLGERSQQIGRIVEVITTIADQTNLLALNAAIEAARAGEAGRGFAVVAEEVRNLAENSAQAAEQIGTLIRSTQQETSQAVSAVEVASKEVDEGRSIIEGVRRALDSILRAAEHSARQVEHIAQAAEMQLINTREVSEAIDEVASIAEKSTTSTEQACGGVQELTAGMEEMASSASELAKMASNLQKLVKQFKVRT